MPTRKVSDLPSHESCLHPEHNLPLHIVLPPGVYEHECPACHYLQVFTIQGVVSGRPRSAAWDLLQG